MREFANLLIYPLYKRFHVPLARWKVFRVKKETFQRPKILEISDK